MNIMETLIGWIAPPQCVSCGREGFALCFGCRGSSIIPYGEQCGFCNASSPLGRTCTKCRGSSPRSVWITTNYSGVAKDLLRIYKFGHQRAALGDLSELMVATLMDFNSEDDIAKRDYLVIPVPTATSRIRQRGFDHCALMARTLARKISRGNTIALGRLGHTRQLGAKRSDRLAQPEGSYFARQPKKIAGRSILLIDDVMTTGATIREATKILRRAGARRVDALIFAKRL